MKFQQKILINCQSWINGKFRDFDVRVKTMLSVSQVRNTYGEISYEY